MLFYTWPFNPRPPLFKGGLCLPLLKVPKRCRPETILLRYCANHRRTRASSKIEKCAESGAMPRNFAKVALRQQNGSFPLPCLRRSSKLHAPLLAELSAKAAFVQALALGRKNCGVAGKNYAQPCERHTSTESIRTTAFKLRQQNAPQDNLNNAHAASTRTTAVRSVKISRNDRFQDKKIPPRALNA